MNPVKSAVITVLLIFPSTIHFDCQHVARKCHDPWVSAASPGLSGRSTSAPTTPEVPKPTFLVWDLVTKVPLRVP